MATAAELTAAALRAGGRLAAHGDDLYLVVPYDEAGWLVYRAESQSPEYNVNCTRTQCTCPMRFDCKHIGMVQRFVPVPVPPTRHKFPWRTRKWQRERGET